MHGGLKTGSIVVAAVLALLAPARPALADPPAQEGVAPAPAAEELDMRSLVKKEVKAYLDAQEKKDAAEKKPEKSDDGNVFKVYWKNGLRLDTKDKSVRLKIGGRVQFDAATYLDDDYVDAVALATGDPDFDLEDGVEVRRVRLYNEGQIGDHVTFKAQIDFAEGAVALKDVFVDLGNVDDCMGCGAPNLRVGHFKAPFSLEELTSSKYLTFMERGLPNAFTPSRLAGGMLHDRFLGDHLGYAAGAFVEGSGSDGDGTWEGDGWGLAGRLWWTPWFECDRECKIWHIGASVWWRNDLDGVRYQQRPESHVTGHRPVDTGLIDDADEALHLGIETAFVYGPWSLQGEAMWVQVDSELAEDPDFFGWYAFASYWLTGECRVWKGGHFDRVSPCLDWLDEECCGKGGWEIAARVSNIDLDDGPVLGGEMMTYTLGLNWHLNPNARVMFNAILADVERETVDETFFAFQTRLEVNW